MSRRPLAPRAGEADRRSSRMALGGRLKSESRIQRFWREGGAMGVAPPLPPVEPPDADNTAWRTFSWTGMGADMSDPEDAWQCSNWFGFQSPEDSEMVTIFVAMNVVSIDALFADYGSSRVDPWGNASAVDSGSSGHTKWSIWKTTWPGGQSGRIYQHLIMSTTTADVNQRGVGIIFRRPGGAATLHAQLVDIQTGAAGAATWPTVPAGWYSPTQVVIGIPTSTTGDDLGLTYRIDTLGTGAVPTGELGQASDCPSCMWLRFIVGWTI